MSLIDCYECETPVSEHADRCGLCRAPIEAEPIHARPLVSWPLVALVVAVTAILAGCGDDGMSCEDRTDVLEAREELVEIQVRNRETLGLTCRFDGFVRNAFGAIIAERWICTGCV